MLNFLPMFGCAGRRTSLTRDCSHLVSQFCRLHPAAAAAALTSLCLLTSVWRVACHSYHTGSLAFGSLILAVVQTVRVVLEYLDSKLRGELASR